MSDKRCGVLVIQPLPGIGDMVWHLPHLAAIAANEPEGRVAVLTKPRSLSDELFSGVDWVECVLWVDRPGKHSGLVGFFRLVKMLRRERFRKVWLLHDSARYALACFMARIPERIGFAGGLQRLLFNVRPRHPIPRHIHTVERADHLLAEMGITVDRAPPLLHAKPSVLQGLRIELAAYQQPYVCLGIGSSYPLKQWGEDNYFHLIRKLASHHGGTYFLLGGDDEAAMTSSLVNRAKSYACVHAWIKQPLQRVMALFSECQLFVGNDTGMLNLAAACGVPSVGVFGHPISIWVAGSSPCIHPVFPDAGPSVSGMRDIPVQAVVDKVNALLSKTHVVRPD